MQTTGMNLRNSAEEITDKIRDWLYNGEPEAGRKGYSSKARLQSTRKPKTVYRFFGERLDAVMKLTDLSNTRLSHAIHMDTSMISRFRTGVRTPVPGSDVTASFSSILYERAEVGGKLRSLARLMEIPFDMLDEDTLHAWLFDDGYTQDREASIAERLLGGFDSFTSFFANYLPPSA